MSRHAHKPLPPLPPLSIKSSHEVVQHHGALNSLDVISTRRVSTFQTSRKRRNGRESIRKIQNLLAHIVAHIDEKPFVGQPAGNIYSADTAAPQLPQVEGLSVIDDDGHMDTFSDIRRQLRSDSQTSSTSVSVYSQDNTVEEIVDIYSKWGSRAPDPHYSFHSVIKPLYLQPAIYSASAAELGESNRVMTSRQRSRASTDGGRTFQKATTLADLIKEEREHPGAHSPFSKTNFNQLKPTILIHSQNSASVNTPEHPQWSVDINYGRNLLPQPLVLRPRTLDEPHRSLSRWSNHSSEEEGVLSNTRDSVISRIRNLSPPFKVPSRSSVVFKEKAEISTIQVFPSVPKSRKRAFSSGRHPMKSPFPIRSPLHKRSHLGDHSDVEQTSFVRRVSNSFKHFSSYRNTPNINYGVISNHARTGDGPDTPLPIKPGFRAMLSPTAVFFQKGALQIQGAMNKAKSAAKVMSREERRRDKLRKKIVIVGTTNPSPSVSRWV